MIIFKIFCYRYGREEMLALYDRNNRPTSELKNFEQIYKPRQRAPVALYNTFGANFVSVLF